MGFTVNPKKRIRQHNGEIVGGAKFTKAFGCGSWEICVLIGGFPNSQNALQCEWRLKKPDGKRRTGKKYSAPQKRVSSLCTVLNLERWTSKSTLDNKDTQFTVWILEEYKELLLGIPCNFEIISVDSLPKNIKQ